MHRVTRATLGTVVIGLVAIFLVAGMVGGGLLAGTHGPSGNSAMKPSVTPSVVGNVSVSAVFTSTFTAYMTLPFTVTFNIAVTNSSINNVTTVVLANTTQGGAVVMSTSLAIAPGQTAYSFVVSSTTLACNDLACSALPQTEFGVSAFVGVLNVTNANATASHGFFLITTPLQATLVSPVSGSSVSVGNVTVSVAYLGSWVAGAVLNIYTTGKTPVLIYTHSFIELTPGIPVSYNWFAGTPGSYNYSIAITTVYQNLTTGSTIHFFNGTVSVLTKGGSVFQNTTKWVNESAISGLSGAAAGTMLLVVGLIIGMIVALVLGRAVMGRPATAPPQPWEGKPGAAAAPNTCTVCGKSFGTPDELAAHGKSEHGMQ